MPPSWTFEKFDIGATARHNSLSKHATLIHLMIHGALRDGGRRAANTPSTRFAFICSRPSRWPSRAFTTSPSQGAVPSFSGDLNAARLPRRSTFSKRDLRNSRDKLRPRRTPKYTPEQTLKRASGETSNETLHQTPKRATSGLTAYQRLELCLPPHLRSANESTPDEVTFVPDAPELAEFALEDFSGGKGFLTYLAIDQGRWRAAVWVVKLLLEHFHVQPTRSSRLSDTIQEWTRTGTLDEVTEHPLYLVPDSGERQTPHVKASSSASLHELTNDKPEDLSRSEILRHRILGLVWRDIGRLIIACSSNHDIAGGGVKSDILEMIALLHHYELMPASIYAYVPAESEDAIQQPPTLHLLSGRIFTALSDAMWRARELTAVEEAKRKGGELMGLEAKGSSYRVRVSGIKPEIWLELILWSCLHGGWISEGASILGSLHRSKASRGQWSPISWRDSLKAVMPFEQADLLDWDSIKYMFDTRSSATMDGVDITGLRVDRTVSSEVINAYIDALLNTVAVGVGSRGLDLPVVMRHIRTLRHFLKRANLNLGGGSWDAMILRLVESGGINIDRDPAIVEQLVAWSPPIGEELQSRRSQAIPTYVLDGSAAVLGLLHRALYTEISKNNLEGALKVFQLLQQRVDNDRHQSLSDFFAHKHLSSGGSDTSAQGLFTSNFSGIEYPSFSTQIPPMTLAAFLELVIANKSFELGNWMLGIDNIDIDGPLIPTSLYPDPHISAAIVHYAAATDNTALLSKITQLGAAQPQNGTSPTLPSELLRAFFNAQIEMRRWDATEKILAYMRDTEGFDWDVGNAATVAKVMVAEGGNCTSADLVGTNFVRAERIFASLLLGKYGPTRSFSAKREAINTLCVVLSTVSPLLATSVRKSNALPKHFIYALRAGAFNSVLEGVVVTLGSEAGRALVDRFAIARRLMQHAAREDEDREVVEEEEQEGEEKVEAEAEEGQEINTDDVSISSARTPAAGSLPRMPRFMKHAMQAGRMSRTNLSITCIGDPPPIAAMFTQPSKGVLQLKFPQQNLLPAETTTYEQDVAMYGSFTNIGPTTVGIVVRQALLEHAKARVTSQQQPEPPSLDIFAWALLTLRRAGLNRSAVRDELDRMETGLRDDEMRIVDIRAREMWRQVIKRDIGREPDASDTEF
jgi:hypothetical protein